MNKRKKLTNLVGVHEETISNRLHCHYLKVAPQVIETRVFC